MAFYSFGPWPKKSEADTTIVPQPDPIKCLANELYSAWRSNLGGKTFFGESIPEWDTLPLPHQIAWMAVAHHASFCLTQPGMPVLPESWRGWRPW